MFKVEKSVVEIQCSNLVWHSALKHNNIIIIRQSLTVKTNRLLLLLFQYFAEPRNDHFNEFENSFQMSAAGDHHKGHRQPVRQSKFELTFVATKSAGKSVGARRIGLVCFYMDEKVAQDS